MNELVESFRNESETLIAALEDLLGEIEEDFSKREKLNEFAQIIDRIMGSARSIANFGFKQTEIEKLGSFAELCKQIGYRGANVKNNDFYAITIAFLEDATESMKKLITALDQPAEMKMISDLLFSTFMNRLDWILEQFESLNVEKTDYTSSTEKGIIAKDKVQNLLESMRY